MTAAVPWVLAALALLAGGWWVRRCRRLIEQERQPAEDAVAMLARWHAEGQAKRDEAWTATIEKILSEADNRD